LANVTVEGQARRWTELVSSIESAPITEYRPFTAKLPAALTGVGGALAIIGGLGVWIRATVTQPGSRTPEEVERVMGHSEMIGWGIAAFGLLALAASTTWYLSRTLPRLAPLVCALVVAVVTVRQLGLLQDRYKVMVQKAVAAAKESASSGFYHAGFGWGAWLLIVASALLALGVLVGLMRELDIRRIRKHAFES
jgi:hypothetical protein